MPPTSSCGPRSKRPAEARAGTSWGTVGPPRKGLFVGRFLGERTYDEGVEETWFSADLKDLASAVDNLALPPAAEAVQQVLALRDRLDAKISQMLAAFDEDQSWAVDGSLSLTAWLAAHGRRWRRDAHREAVTARRLACLPVTMAAWAAGDLSSGQVAAIVANVSSERASLYAEHEAEMTLALSELSVADTATAMRAWRLYAEAVEDGREIGEAPSELYVSQALNGRREVSGHFGAEDSAVVEAALRSAAQDPPLWEAEGPVMSAAEVRAEAFVNICRWYLNSFSETDLAKRQRPQVSVIVELADLAGGGPGCLVDGTPLDADATARISGDSVLHRVLASGRSRILDYGTSVRTISPALWAALVVRDRHCRHPGCDRPPPWCEAHHVVHFARGGPTRLDNLVLACSRHHHLWHERGWELTLENDATLRFVSPLGLLLSSEAPGRLVV